MSLAAASVFLMKNVFSATADLPVFVILHPRHASLGEEQQWLSTGPAYFDHAHTLSSWHQQRVSTTGECNLVTCAGDENKNPDNEINFFFQLNWWIICNFFSPRHHFPLPLCFDSFLFIYFFKRGNEHRNTWTFVLQKKIGPNIKFPACPSN